MVVELDLAGICDSLRLPHPRQSVDVAELNLICAAGLPGAEDLDTDACLRRLDEIAADIKRIIFARENYGQFLGNPARFRNSQAYFCIVCMLSVLRTKYDVRYNPKWQHITPESDVPKDFCRDARDQHIHAILDGDGGTCGSLPVFFVAIGRRLGFPLKLVKAYRHLFIRWDDPQGSWLASSDLLAAPQGEVFNIEATGAGVHCLTDDDYARRWPKPIPQKHIDAGIYLRPLSPEEELAEFLAARACCLIRNRNFWEASKALQWSYRLAPHNSLRKSELDRLSAHLQVLRRGPYLNQPVPSFFEQTGRPGARWIPLNDGSHMLVQIVSSDPDPTSLSKRALRGPTPTHPYRVDLPFGGFAEVEIPQQTTFRPLVAYWVELSTLEYALVHRPLSSMQQAMFLGAQYDLQRLLFPSPNRQIGHFSSGPAWGLFGGEEQEIINAVREVKSELKGISHQPPPRLGDFAPAIGYVPTHASLPVAPGPVTPFPRLSV